MLKTFLEATLWALYGSIIGLLMVILAYKFFGPYMVGLVVNARAQLAR